MLWDFLTASPIALRDPETEYGPTVWCTSWTVVTSVLEDQVRRYLLHSMSKTLPCLVILVIWARISLSCDFKWWHGFRWKKALSCCKDRAKNSYVLPLLQCRKCLVCYSARASLDSIDKLSRWSLCLQLTQDLDKSFPKGPAKDNVISSLVFVDSVEQMAIENNLSLNEHKSF